MSQMPARSPRLFFLIFTVSGFSGLIYEAIWSHYLKLFLGHAAYAQTLVLSIFMGGMALGAWLVSRYSVRIVNLLAGYALVEGVIGLLGLIFHRTSHGVTAWAFDALLPNMESVALAHAVKWALGGLLILPQSILLGMTFPLMSGAIVRRFPERSGETLAMLYFTNSLGAALGVLVSGFVLIGLVGLPGTIMTAGLLNVSLALFVWGVWKYQPDVVQPAPPPAPPRASDTTVPAVLRWMLFGAALTGAASFFYEIAWIRMLSLVLGSSTHSFEMMLSAFILGIALGGLWVHRRIDRLSNPVRFLSTILTIMAIVAIASLPLYNLTFDLMSQVVQTFSPTEQGYVGVNIASHAIAMLVMIPTTFFCGMTLPIMTQVLIRAGTGERAIGGVYAWNTAGAILGVIVAVHLLMPSIGVKGLVLTGAALQLALAVAYRYVCGGEVSGLRASAAPALISIAVLIGAALIIHLDPARLTSGVFRHGRARFDDTAKVLFLEHGKTASISLVDVAGTVSIATNGKPDAAISMTGKKAGQDEITMVLAGAIPYALHPNPQRVAAIGFGSGLTTHVLLTIPTVKEMDTVEIEPLVAKAARIGFMPRVERAFNDPRSHLYFEDAKTFFAVNRKKYDVIVSEPSNPWVSGVSSLFSEEFYDQITRYLEPDGMLVQWIQTYETDMDIVMSIVKALDSHFTDFAIYNTDSTNLLVVAVRQGNVRAIDPRIFATAALRAELERVGVESTQDIRSRFLGDRKLIAPLARAYGVPANSDYFPYVDLTAPRARVLKHNAIEFTGLQTLSVPFFELLDGSPDPRDATSPSDNPVTPRDYLTQQAVAIRDAILTSRYDGLWPDDVRMISTLRSSKEQCTDPAIRGAWLSSAVYVAEKTNSPLGAREASKLWDNLANTPCAQLLEGSDRNLFSLLQAVARRDAASVSSLGSGLLADAHSLSEPDQKLFAVLATAAGAISLNQPRAALDVIAKQGDRVPQNATVLLALKWLTALAAEESNAARAEVARSERGS